MKKRVFYRDTSSLSAEAQSIRWSGNILNDGGVYLSAANANTIGGMTVSNTADLPQEVFMGLSIVT